MGPKVQVADKVGCTLMIFSYVFLRLRNSVGLVQVKEITILHQFGAYTD